MAQLDTVYILGVSEIKIKAILGPIKKYRNWINLGQLSSQELWGISQKWLSFKCAPEDLASNPLLGDLFDKKGFILWLKERYRRLEDDTLQNIAVLK